MTVEKRQEENLKKRQKYHTAKKKLAFETPSKDCVKKAKERIQIPKRSGVR